jgi:hypothetical protein
MAYRNPPWCEITGIRAARLVSPFIPYWTGHLLRQPYRHTPQSRPLNPGRQSLRFKSRIAAYDSVINLMLDGFAEISGQSIDPMTGPLVVVFNRLVGAFDDEFEDRVETKRPLSFDDVLGSAAVHARLLDLRAFLEPCQARETIRSHLLASAAQQYERYVQLMTSGPLHPDQALDARFEAALIDSAGFLVSLVHVISLFNGVVADEAVTAQFAALGIVGKFADDIVDFWPDARHERFNLLDGHLRRHSAELALVRGLIADPPPRTTLRWWSRRCPESIAELSATLAGQMDRLNSRAMRRAAEILLIPPLWGHTMLKSEPSSGRL